MSIAASGFIGETGIWRVTRSTGIFSVEEHRIAWVSKTCEARGTLWRGDVGEGMKSGVRVQGGDDCTGVAGSGCGIADRLWASMERDPLDTSLTLWEGTTMDIARPRGWIGGGGTLDDEETTVVESF
jgi:hypothetical protein